MTTKKHINETPARRDASRAAERGFTLFELVISVSLGVIVMLSAAYLASELLQSAATTFEGTDMEDTKSAVGNTFTTDFRAAGNYLIDLTPEAAASTTYVDEVLADTPKLYWRLDDKAGEVTAEDLSGNRYHGSSTGAITFGIPGAIQSDPGTAAQLAGASSGILASPDFGTPTSAFAVEYWFKPSSTTNYNQALRTDNNLAGYPPDGNWFCATDATGSMHCGTSVSTQIDQNLVPASTIRVGQWHHVVYSQDGTAATLYLNGKELATKTEPAALGWTGLKLADIDGQIDEVAVYFHALTRERVRAHYIAGVAPPIPENVAGMRRAALPLVSWQGNGFSLQRPADVVTIDSATGAALILSADEQFSPTTAQQQFTGSSSTIVTRAGTRGEPKTGDYLLAADYVGGQSVLVQVTDAVQTSTGADGNQLWTIPVAAVPTTSPAWGALAADPGSLSATFPRGTTVVRMNPPVVYSLQTAGPTKAIVRTEGTNNQTLALGVASFTIAKTVAATPASWDVAYQLESEQINTSNHADYKQLSTARLTLTPNALNPSTR